MGALMLANNNAFFLRPPETVEVQKMQGRNFLRPPLSPKNN